MPSISKVFILKSTPGIDKRITTELAKINKQTTTPTYIVIYGTAGMSRNLRVAYKKFVK